MTPADVAPTVDHLLGIDPALKLRDNLRRPLRLGPKGDIGSTKGGHTTKGDITEWH